ncbi:MAG: YgdI/YgdR family lipoprotein, partial [Treponemataceae bacterium]|nr:YgdI/YgdR family lipoprotein [Treponemataceae bacterium]
TYKGDLILKKMIIAVLMAIMMFALAGCETHERSTTTTVGRDSDGNTYTIVMQYIDGELVSKSVR